MPYCLNQKLKPFNYQVSNLGVSGYGIDQYFLFLKRHVNKFRNLNYVILIICTDLDFKETINNTRYGKRKPLYIFKEDKIILSNVPINKFNLRNIFSASGTLNILSIKYKKFKDFLNSLARDKKLDRREGSKVIDSLLKKIYDITSEHKARLIVVTIPCLEDFTDKSYDLIWFQNYFHENKKNYLYIDFYDVLSGYLKALDKIYYDRYHFREYGNKLLAETILKNIDVD